jgi:hypothetical protein
MKEYSNPRYCIDKYIATAKNKLVNPDKSDAFLWDKPESINK